MEYLSLLCIFLVLFDPKNGEAKEASIGATDDSISQRQVLFQARPCITPNHRPGICSPIGSCPQPVLTLNSLRRSFCMQNLIVLGVCCQLVQPIATDTSTSGTTSTSTTTTTAAPSPTISNYTSHGATSDTMDSYVTTVIESPPMHYISYSGADNFIGYKPSSGLNGLTFDKQPFDLQSSNSDISGTCGIGGRNARVVGGHESHPGQWPWMAALFIITARGKEFWCGGSLIDTMHILTAAHCLSDRRGYKYSPRQMVVRMGEHHLLTSDSRNIREYSVADLRPHPQFQRNGFYNDIGIVRLKRPVQLSEYVKPVCLPTGVSSRSMIGTMATVVGWGALHYGTRGTGSMQQVSMPIWSNKDCDQRYYQPITSNFICAGYNEGGKDACQGDSGSPLMVPNNSRQWTVIGIVSFGTQCASPGYPGVYTRVTEYVDWIRANTH